MADDPETRDATHSARADAGLAVAVGAAVVVGAALVAVPSESELHAVAVNPTARTMAT
ncbi:MAG: hypothetical protein HKN95_13015 [Acidimicrobiia bacterium]|nr:hypothetical protein [Acidimicrobiia bacterium]